MARQHTEAKIKFAKHTIEVYDALIVAVHIGLDKMEADGPLDDPAIPLVKRGLEQMQADQAERYKQLTQGLLKPSHDTRS